MKYTYCFDQLQDTEENWLRRFESYERTAKEYGGVDLDRYFTADSGIVAADSPEEACERLFMAYNRDTRPHGYEGRSMSVSDVVRLWDNTVAPPVEMVFFCDSFGFRKL